MSSETKQKAVMLRNACGLRQDDSFINVTPRTVQRWASEAAKDLADETHDDDWRKLSAHDLRRWWVTATFYRLITSGGTNDVYEILMRWGGWTGEETLKNNYLRRIPDVLSAELMQQADLS